MYVTYHWRTLQNIPHCYPGPYWMNKQQVITAQPLKGQDHTQPTDSMRWTKEDLSTCAAVSASASLPSQAWHAEGANAQRHTPIHCHRVAPRQSEPPRKGTERYISERCLLHSTVTKNTRGKMEGKRQGRAAFLVLWERRTCGFHRYHRFPMNHLKYTDIYLYKYIQAEHTGIFRKTFCLKKIKLLCQEVHEVNFNNLTENELKKWVETL